jgi:hypothetical protein
MSSGTLQSAMKGSKKQIFMDKTRLTYK